MAEYEIDIRKLKRQVMRSLKWRLRLTRLAIGIERFAHCFWPVISWTLMSFAGVHLGVLFSVGQTVAIAGLASSALFWLWLFGKGAQRFRWPNREDAKLRLDRDLPERPLEALGDRQVIGTHDALSRFMWARHLSKMAESAKISRAPLPCLRLAKRDPLAFRLIAVFMFAGAVLFTRMDSVQSLVQNLQSGGPTVLAGPSWEAWAEPPTYTGKPAIYLSNVESGNLLLLAQGTRITFRAYGDVDGSDLARTVLTQTVSAGADTVFAPTQNGFGEVSFEVKKSGIVSLVSPQAADVGWDVTMIADEVPKVALLDEIKGTLHGTLEMPFEVRDDYGVVGGTVTIDLIPERVDRRHGLTLAPEPRAPLVLDVPLPFTRKKSAFEEKVIEDLADHPWAGLPVKVVMSVSDDLGQTGIVETTIEAMPQKRFFDSVAAAVAEQRRDLLWNRANAKRITMILKAVTHQPEAVFAERGSTPYLIIRTALRRLEYNADAPLSDQTRNEVSELLWRAALLIEDGDIADAQERLKRAQKRLSEAMKNGATPDEIAELMDDLRQAMADYLRQLAKNQQKNQDQKQAQGDDTRQVSSAQLDELMNRIQELMEQGRMDEAQALMEMLGQMMQNMRVGNGGAGSKTPYQSAMEGLGDTLREQQGLADDTFTQLQGQLSETQQNGSPDGAGLPNQNQQDGTQNGGRNGDRSGGEPGASSNRQLGQGQGQGMTPAELAERQQALRELLEQQQRRFGGNGVPGGEELGQNLSEAERLMSEAEQNLRDGGSADALDNQADAMEAIRKGMRDLSEAQSNGNGQQGTQAGRRGAQRDPLGRPLNGSGYVGTNKRFLSNEEKYRRSREIMDEIRRRSGDRTRPSLELDYLNRLLERF